MTGSDVCVIFTFYFCKANVTSIVGKPVLTDLPLVTAAAFAHSMHTMERAILLSTLKPNPRLLAVRFMTLPEAKKVVDSNASSPLKDIISLSPTILGYHTWTCAPCWLMLKYTISPTFC
jgi:hypothetical protein